jgi:hypothetical protein
MQRHELQRMLPLLGIGTLFDEFNCYQSMRPSNPGILTERYPSFLDERLV